MSTLIILVLAEFLPKTLFRIFPNSLLNFLAIPLALFYFLFYPLASFTIVLTNSFLKRFFKTEVKSNSKNLVFGRVDLDAFVKENDSGRQETNMNIDKEIKLFKNALDFTKVKLREIMVPRTEIEMLDIKY